MNGVRSSYDYIIMGAGCAGLSLAMHLSRSGITQHKSVLLVDHDAKLQNDRTWSFWETGTSMFEDIVHHRWSSLEVYTPYGHLPLDIDPYVYKMIRGIDYYDYARRMLSSDDHVDWVQGQAQLHDSRSADVTVDGVQVTGGHVFKTFADGPVDTTQHLFTLQHFGGWFVEVVAPLWDPSCATFMDFRIEQVAGQTRFCYVLPVSPTRALVEVAIYSDAPWTDRQYDVVLEEYIARYITGEHYHVADREYGVIPMTDYPFWDHDTATVTHIGTAGGAVKPSSGYAFSRIHKQSRAIVDHLNGDKPWHRYRSVFKDRFLRYDATLLHVLLRQRLESAKVFHTMFDNNTAALVLAFLNEETSLLQEVDICSSMPTIPFSKGFMATLF